MIGAAHGDTAPADRRVVLVVPSARRTGGGDVWLDQMLGHLGLDGPNPLVVFEGTGELEQSAVAAGCDTMVLPGGDDDERATGLARILASTRPSVTVFWSPKAQLYGAPAHRAAGRPGRTAWVQHVMPSTFWVHAAASRLPADRVICVSEAVRRRQETLYPHRKAVVVRPGLDLAGPPLPRSTARRALGCPAERSVVGVVGRVEPWKGQDVAVRMLADLNQGGRDVHLMLLGERYSPTWPEFEPVVDGLVGTLGLAANVTYAGHAADVPSVLPALDVLVCASREEGFGLALVEAMAVGVPVVSTACGGPADIIEHGETGLLVPVEDPATLADAVRLVLTEPTIADRFVRGAKARWHQRFTADVTGAAFRAVLAELAAPS